VLRQATAEYPLSTPKPLWSEQSPEDWWHGVLSCIQQIGESNPDAIGLSGQMHGAVFLDRAGEVIRPAILWNDQRTATECIEIDNSVGKDRYREIALNPPLTGFQLPKLVWLRNHELSNYQKLQTLLLPKDYIRWRMTGERVTEVSDASGIGLLDIRQRAWSDELISALELNSAWFPSIVESDGITGHTRGVPGLADGIPVVGGGGDQAAGAVGTGAVTPGIISVSLGTSGVVFSAVENPEYDPTDATHTFCHANRGWHRMGVMLSCGGAVKWARDTFLPSLTFDEMTNLAATSQPGSQGLSFLPYLAGERSPHNDPNLRGAYAGLTLAHGAADLARATFEGVTFGLLDGFRAIVGPTGTASQVRVTGGGAKSGFWSQLIADAFRASCVRLEVDEGPAFGAAILAGVGIGIWTSTQNACLEMVRVANVISPSGEDYGKHYDNFRSFSLPLRDWSAKVTS
jgi:xylulokinase